jgi:hypothetical protein
VSEPPYKSTHLWGWLVSLAAPTVLFVGAAGLMGPEHTHYRGASSPSCPYKKVEPLLKTIYVVVLAT